MKKVLLFILILTICFASMVAMCSCASSNKSDWTKYTAGEFGIKNQNNPLVQITFSTGDTVRIELYPDVAPKTVENFIQLSKSGFYDGLTMHRIIENFMIQGGGYTYDGESLRETSKNAKNINGEFSANGWTKNNVSHQKGVISMARSSSYDSASSQFFICSVDCKYLDGSYCAFGRVIDEESMQAIIKISKVQTANRNLIVSGQRVTMQDVPIQPINITKIEVAN